MRWLLKTIFVMSLLLLVGCQKNSEGKQTLKEVRIGILQVPNDVSVARQRGYLDKYFASKNLKAQYIIFDSGVDANKALISGDIDFATMGDTNAVVAKSSGIDAKLVWVNDILGNNEGLVVRNNSGINSIQDLKGKKIATPFASTSHYSLMMTLKKYHLLNKVTLIDMDTQDIVAAWRRKDISAAYSWQPTLDQMLKNGHFLMDSEQLRKKGKTTANVTLVRGEFARENPEIVRGFLRQLDKSHKLMQEDPNLAIKSAAKQSSITFKEAKSQIGTSKWLTIKEFNSSNYLADNGEFVDQLDQTAEFMSQQQTINKAPGKKQFNNFIDDQYIKELGDR